jgi:hypothetical protein
VARTVIVGDVHGCAAELGQLLDRVGLQRDDRLVLVGDLVARGPDSRGVLEIVRRTGGRSVLGNHEQRLLEAWTARRRGVPGPKLGSSHARTLAELCAADFALLSAFPRRIEIREHGILVVHAGVLPGKPLEAQDPWVLTHIRSVDPLGNPSSRLTPPLWGSLYTGPPHVVFGHNALAGLQLHDWATGLDTGCVYGGKLSALVLSAGEAVPPPKERASAIVSVAARRAYFG